MVKDLCSQVGRFQRTEHERRSKYLKAELKACFMGLDINGNSTVTKLCSLVDEDKEKLVVIQKRMGNLDPVFACGEQGHLDFPSK